MKKDGDENVGRRDKGWGWVIIIINGGGVLLELKKVTQLTSKKKSSQSNDFEVVSYYTKLFSSFLFLLITTRDL